VSGWFILLVIIFIIMCLVRGWDKHQEEADEADATLHRLYHKLDEFHAEAMQQWAQSAPKPEPEFKGTTYDVEPINRIEDKRQ